MAYLLSTSLFTPFCFSESPFQGTHTRSLTGGRLINHTSRTGIKHLLHKYYIDGGMTSLSRSYHCSIYFPTRQHLEPISCHFGECFIVGFWVGPDIEDGWGFVEASVHGII